MHAHEHDGAHDAGKRSVVRRDDLNILGPDDDVHRLVRVKALVDAVEAHPGKLDEIILRHDAGQDVAFADEIRHEGVFRLVVNVDRGADLLDEAFSHHDDGVAHGQGFFLVVGDVNKGDAKLLLHALQLDLHLFSKLEVQSAQGFVQQENLGLVGKGPGDGHALLLAAGKGVHRAVFKAGKLDHLQHFADFFVYLVLVDLSELQAESDVVIYVQMGKQRVSLENRVDLALMGGDVGNVLPVDIHFSGRRRLETGDQPQHRGFAAARGTEKRQKFAVSNIKVDAFERFLAVEVLRQINQINQMLSHVLPPETKMCPALSSE